MNQRLQKITYEIEKLRKKLNNYQNRLRDLERQKTELENADIVALVRGVDIPPDELMAFIKAFKDQSGDSVVAIPNIPGLHETDYNIEEKTDDEIN